MSEPGGNTVRRAAGRMRPRSCRSLALPPSPRRVQTARSITPAPDSTPVTQHVGRAASVRDFFWELVPPHLVANLGAHLPLEALRGGGGDLGQPGRVGHCVDVGVGWHVVVALLAQRGELREVPGDGPPPSPVGAEDLLEARLVDAVRRAVGTGVRGYEPASGRRLTARREPGEEVEDVAGVLRVELDDLELR